ncbi:hypothetical protein EVAR_82847_1 [Eumeta japonica]|uniref:Uncharacterized protein n=1 Tax=Eumeta variegata TaxID=151549 RepID=A0A4C1V380_EUMVA|nr:hypothetical protein EVAR_82847_1 [Eumeta japonica]
MDTVYRENQDRGREVDASQAESLGRSCLSIAGSALSLAHSAQAERDNVSYFFVRAAGVIYKTLSRQKKINAIGQLRGQRSPAFVVAGSAAGSSLVVDVTLSDHCTDCSNGPPGGRCVRSLINCGREPAISVRDRDHTRPRIADRWPRRVRVCTSSAQLRAFGFDK